MKDARGRMGCGRMCFKLLMKGMARVSDTLRVPLLKDLLFSSQSDVSVFERTAIETEIFHGQLLALY